MSGRGPPPGLSARAPRPRGAPPRGAPPRGPPPRGPPPRGPLPTGAPPPGLSSGTPAIVQAKARPPSSISNNSGPPKIKALKKSFAPSSSSNSDAKSSGGPRGASRSKGLTASQLDEIKECFAMFDRDSDGFIILKEVGVLMMSLGLSPTREELNLIMKSISPKKRGHVSLDEFIEIVKSDTRKVTSGDEILEGFKIYDQMMSRQRNNGKILVKELRQVMTTFGEKLNHDEVEGMIGFADDCTFNGNIDYEKFVDKMMNPNK